MEIRMDLPPFSADRGIEYKWESGYEISAECENGVITITANREGLISLANHLLSIAQNEVPVGHRLHLDEYNSLEECSLELIVQKM